jgi:hypothetical protein
MEGMIDLKRLTLREMIQNIDLYIGLSSGLIQLPVPQFLKIGRKKLKVPESLDEFCKSICYGQRVFLTQKEDNDFGLILRMIDGYYYSIYSSKEWDSDKALQFGKIVLTCKVEYLYPVAMYLVKLVNEMSDREIKLLHREPSKIELAAGIEKLNVFSEMTALHFLRDAMKITVPEVLLTPYNECLVHFMIAKEINQYQENYYKLIQEQSKLKGKYYEKIQS